MKLGKLLVALPALILLTGQDECPDEPTETPTPGIETPTPSATPPPTPTPAMELTECSVPEDYSSIEGCVNAVVPGGTVFVGPGEHTLNIDLDGKSLRLVGTAGAEETTINAASTSIDSIIDTGNMLGSGWLTVEGLTFSDGLAYEGGALRVHRGTLRVENCIFAGNTALEIGGAIYAEEAWTTIVDSLFYDNTASTGGALSIVNGNTAEINESRFSGNMAEGGSGGALHMFYATVSITNSLFDWNFADEGGATQINLGAVTFTGVSIVNNQAEYVGGGISSYDSTLNASGLLVAGNGSNGGEGGGMFLDDPEGVMAHVTVADNYSYWRGAGIAVYGSSQLPLVLRSSILSHNVVADAYGTWNDYDYNNLGFNLWQQSSGSVEASYTTFWYRGDAGEAEGVSEDYILRSEGVEFRDPDFVWAGEYTEWSGYPETLAAEYLLQGSSEESDSGHPADDSDLDLNGDGLADYPCSGTDATGRGAYSGQDAFHFQWEIYGNGPLTTE